MATLRSGRLEFYIDCHSLDSCGDIVYAYQFLCEGKNIINPEILHDWYKDGIFLTTECDFENSEVIDFFTSVIETLDGRRYASLEPPIVGITCIAWNDFKDKRINKWKNSKGINGHRHYSDKSIEEFCELWEKDIYLTFSLSEGFFIHKHAEISLDFSTTTDILEIFILEFRQEFEQFKKDKMKEHLEKTAYR